MDVDRYLNNGWNLYAQPIVRGNDIYQAMVKYEKTIFPPLPTPPPLPPGPPPHPLLDTRPLPHPLLDTRPLPHQTFYSIPPAEEASAKAFANSMLYKQEEIKQMQDACNELIKVLEGKSTDYQYGGNKSTYVCNMPEKLRNHLKGMGYDFSPVESHRNEEYCYMFLA